MPPSTGSTSELPLALLAATLSDFREFLHVAQRPRFRDAQWADNCLARSRDFQTRFARLGATLAQSGHEMAERVGEMAEALLDWSREFSLRRRSRRLKEASQTLSLRYEGLIRQMQRARERTREAGNLVSLKPANYTRNVFHAMMGLGAIAAYELLLTWSQAQMVVGLMALAAFLMETTRRFIPEWNLFLVTKVFGAIARPREMHRTNGATYYTMALLLMVLFFSPRATELAILVLSLADPAATLLGRRFGRRKLYGDKSWVGTSAFFVTALVVGVVFGLIALPWLPLSQRFLMAALVALAGTIGELGARRIDDNFTIPMLCVGVASVWLPILG